MPFVDPIQLETLLTTLSFELKKSGLWSDVSPSAEQLASQQPFCCDTLRFEQWLQYVFIPKLTLMLKQPNMTTFACNIFPMAEESFKFMQEQPSVLMNTIKALDNTLSHGAQ